MASAGRTVAVSIARLRLLVWLLLTRWQQKHGCMSTACERSPAWPLPRKNERTLDDPFAIHKGNILLFGLLAATTSSSTGHCDPVAESRTLLVAIKNNGTILNTIHL